MITINQKGDFSNITRYLTKVRDFSKMDIFDKYGKLGVEALSSATPLDSGKTASSWTYRIVKKRGSVSLEFHNTNQNAGVNIAVILQYGHGTRNGGYVQGRDYINPAIRPIFDQLSNDLWREVTRV